MQELKDSQFGRHSRPYQGLRLWGRGSEPACAHVGSSAASGAGARSTGERGLERWNREEAAWLATLPGGATPMVFQQGAKR